MLASLSCRPEWPVELLGERWRSRPRCRTISAANGAGYGTDGLTEPWGLAYDAAEQGDEADEAFGGTVARQKCRLMPAPANFGRGHRFAAYPRCWADQEPAPDDGTARPGGAQ
jgi:hypothetical protein